MATNGEDTMNGVSTRALVRASTPSDEAYLMERARTSIHEHSQLKLTCDIIRLQDQLARLQSSIEEQVNDVVEQNLHERTKSEGNTEHSDAIDRLEKTLPRLTDRAASTPTLGTPAPHVMLPFKRIDHRLEESNARIEKHEQALEGDKLVLDKHGQEILALMEENAHLKMQREDVLTLLDSLRKDNAQAQQERKDILALSDLLQNQTAQLKRQCEEVLALKTSIKEEPSLTFEGSMESLAIKGAHQLPNGVYDQHFRDVGEILGTHSNDISTLTRLVKEIQGRLTSHGKTNAKVQAQAQNQGDDDDDEEFIDESDTENEPVSWEFEPEQKSNNDGLLPSEIVTYHENRIDSLERKLDQLSQSIRDDTRAIKEKSAPQTKKGTGPWGRDEPDASDGELHPQLKTRAANTALEARVKILERGAAEQERRHDIEVLVETAGVFALQETFHKINREHVHGAGPDGLTFGISDDDRMILKERALERLVMFDQVMEMYQEVKATEDYAVGA